MREIVDQCLGLIVKDDVDQVVWAFDQTYFWFIKNNYTYETLKNKNILRQFLEQISQNLDQKKYTRQIITNTDMANRVIRDKNTIAKIIKNFLRP